jgi:hypothetical protein
VKYIPRGPFVIGDAVAAEWRITLGRLTDTPFPRARPEPAVRRPWLEYWRSIGEAAGVRTIPAGALFDDDGYLTREWREWVGRL